jgi:hypothetical protein
VPFSNPGLLRRLVGAVIRVAVGRGNFPVGVKVAVGVWGHPWLGLDVPAETRVENTPLVATISNAAATDTTIDFQPLVSLFMLLSP